jgi:hypothetical protein
MTRGECRDGQWIGKITVFWESNIEDNKLEAGVVRIVY